MTATATKTTRREFLAITGGGSMTLSPSGENAPCEWRPQTFATEPSTVEGQPRGDGMEDLAWARLAAAARRDWASENPF